MVGLGIQRNYGLKEKRFSLFNIGKWADDTIRPKCCHVVPTLGTATVFNSTYVDTILRILEANGSFAAPGFMKPEGIVIYHKASGHLFKKTLEKDEEPKSVARS